ncbi:hypothetical protein I3843_05G043700 [Carya illinoinensis]|nr:hypothetical protein I3843_05G043700 [Carya illinoinensis]
MLESKRDIFPILHLNGAAKELLLFPSIYLPIKLSTVLVENVFCPSQFLADKVFWTPCERLIVAYVLGPFDDFRSAKQISANTLARRRSASLWDSRCLYLGHMIYRCTFAQQMFCSNMLVEVLKFVFDSQV